MCKKGASCNHMSLENKILCRKTPFWVFIVCKWKGSKIIFLFKHKINYKSEFSKHFYFFRDVFFHTRQNNTWHLIVSTMHIPILHSPFPYTYFCYMYSDRVYYKLKSMPILASWPKPGKTRTHTSNQEHKQVKLYAAIYKDVLKIKCAIIKLWTKKLRSNFIDWFQAPR